MSFNKEVYETWVHALERYDIGDFPGALAGFELIQDASARIRFNIGIIYATIGEHQKAISSFNKALKKDHYLAIAYFQRGVSNFLISKYDDALTDFASARQHMRDNKHINYEQLGLRFSLYSCEVLFNRGLCHKHLGRKDAAMLDLANAAREKKVPDRHEVIDEALGNRGDGYTVFSVPVGTIFRIAEAKLRTAGHRPHQSTDVTKKTSTDSRPHQRSKSAITLPSHHNRTGSNDKNLPPIPTEKRRPATIATQKPRDNYKVQQQPPPPTSRTDVGRKPSISSHSGRPTVPMPIPVTVAPLRIDKSSGGSSSSSRSVSSNSSSSSIEDDSDYDYVPDYYGSEYSGWSEASRPSSGDTNDYVVLRGGGRMVFGKMKKIKVKIHYDDLIVIYIDPTISYRELTARVQAKLKLRGACKIKFKDEDGQQILLGDQEDLDHAIGLCGGSARQADAEVGKMEIWVSDP
ncbi:hypothetical protein TWF696_009238 [Orbilia brochopaga]|uniref:PB1 domain-containing protein n=1 Tax=Orbilia brochopaga TaxID=3140254 RepID=A0AAV9UEM4_9PEZI